MEQVRGSLLLERWVQVLAAERRLGHGQGGLEHPAVAQAQRPAIAGDLMRVDREDLVEREKGGGQRSLGEAAERSRMLPIELVEDPAQPGGPLRRTHRGDDDHVPIRREFELGVRVDAGGLEESLVEHEREAVARPRQGLHHGTDMVAGPYGPRNSCHRSAAPDLAARSVQLPRRSGPRGVIDHECTAGAGASTDVPADASTMSRKVAVHQRMSCVVTRSTNARLRRWRSSGAIWTAASMERPMFSGS